MPQGALWVVACRCVCGGLGGGERLALRGAGSAGPAGAATSRGRPVARAVDVVRGYRGQRREPAVTMAACDVAVGYHGQRRAHAAESSPYDVAVGCRGLRLRICCVLISLSEIETQQSMPRRSGSPSQCPPFSNATRPAHLRATPHGADAAAQTRAESPAAHARGLPAAGPHPRQLLGRRAGPPEAAAVGLLVGRALPLVRVAASVRSLSVISRRLPRLHRVKRGGVSSRAPAGGRRSRRP
jgi:hypothetical protein